MPASKALLRKACSWIVPAALVGVLASCGSVGQNAVRAFGQEKQVADPAAGAGGLAMTALRATALAAVKQPVTTAKTGIALAWHRSRTVVVGNVPISTEPAEPPCGPPGSADFERFLDREGLPPAQRGSLRLLVDGPEFFAELDRRLDAARHSVDVQVYIFDNDDVACRYADKLREVAETRSVRVLFDDLGTSWASISAPVTPAPDGFKPPANIRRYLVDDSAVRARRTLNPWLAGDHTKLLLFDREVALLGGMNIGREYFSEWHDLMVEVRGPVVATLQREFDESWATAGPFGDFAGGPAELSPVHEPAGLRVLRTDPAAGRLEVLRAIIAAMRASRERVWIESPYLASDDVVRAAAAAARRGVDVRVVIPGSNDSQIMNANHVATARELVDAGAKVYSYPGMSHLKAMICDGWATVGSANLDMLSMRINRELNLAFTNPASVEALERRVFREDFGKSRRLRAGELESLVAPLAESIADQL